MKNLITLLLLMASTVTWAGNGDPDDSMIEVGGGIQTGKTTTVLIRVEANSAIDVNHPGIENAYFILAKVRANVASDGKTVSMVDLKIEGLGLGSIFGDKYLHAVGDKRVYVEADLLRFSLQRNLAVDQLQNVRISVVALSAGADSKITDDVILYAKTALDFAAYSSFERASDGYLANKALTPFLSLELGAKIKERFQIAVGGEFSTLKEKAYGSTSSTSTTSCATYNQPACPEENPACTSWQTTVTCGPSTSTGNYSNKVFYGDAFIELRAAITKNLSAFGRADYVVFKVHGDEVPANACDPNSATAIPSSKNTALQFKFGVAYRF